MPQRTVKTSFWSDPLIQKIPQPAKGLILYLITANSGHVGGIYYAPVGLIAEEWGYPSSVVRESLDVLERATGACYHCKCRHGRVSYDPSVSVVWVTNMLKHQPGVKNPAIHRAVAKQIEDLHGSSLVTQFLRHYSELSIPYEVPPPLGGGVQGTLEGYQSPDSDTDTDSVSGVPKEHILMGGGLSTAGAKPTRKPRRPRRVEVSPTPVDVEAELSALGQELEPLARELLGNMVRSRKSRKISDNIVWRLCRGIAAMADESRSGARYGLEAVLGCRDFSYEGGEQGPLQYARRAAERQRAALGSARTRFDKFRPQPARGGLSGDDLEQLAQRAEERGD
jgi:hypothetical protein